MPIDEELFLRCWSLYTSFSSPGVAAEHANKKRRTLLADIVVGLDNMPSESGVIAVKKELQARNVSKVTDLSVTMRVLYFERVLEARERFAPWIVSRGANNAIEIAEALVRAGAQAGFKMVNGDISFDLDDIERKAKENANSSRYSTVRGLAESEDNDS